MKPSFSTPAVRRRGFTLLEVMVAVAILGLVMVTVYQFVGTTLRAASYSEKSGQEDDALAGLRRLVTAQLAAMPDNSNGTLVGVNVNKDGVRRDALQMVCSPGNAVLTPDAHGFYQVTLDLAEQPSGGGRYALSLEREPWTDGTTDDQPDAGKPSKARPADVLRLMDGVQALEIGYYDTRLNGWVDRWTDPQALPNLVRLRVTTSGRPEPYEMILRVPGGGLTRVQTLAPPNINAAMPNLNGVPSAPPSYVPGAPPTYVPQPPPNLTVPQPPPNLRQPPPNLH